MSLAQQQKTNMSLGTSQPSVRYCADKVNAKYAHGRPEHELVPSRYALKVGAIDVTVISDGVLSLPGAMLGHNADPSVRAAWLEDKFLPPDVLEWALNVVLVRSGDQTILVDAGIGQEFPDLKRAGQLVRRLDDAGIDLIRDRRGADSPAHGPHRRLAHRRGEGATASGSADPRGGFRGQVLGRVARFLPRLHATGIPRRATTSFVGYRVPGSTDRLNNWRCPVRQRRIVAEISARDV